ncbi:hypothetical protein HK405_012575, partial [Cladochytrium tenue]
RRDGDDGDDDDGGALHGGRHSPPPPQREDRRAQREERLRLVLARRTDPLQLLRLTGVAMPILGGSGHAPVASGGGPLVVRDSSPDSTASAAGLADDVDQSDGGDASSGEDAKKRKRPKRQAQLRTVDFDVRAVWAAEDGTLQPWAADEAVRIDRFDARALLDGIAVGGAEGPPV